MDVKKDRSVLKRGEKARRRTRTKKKTAVGFKSKICHWKAMTRREREREREIMGIRKVEDNEK